MELSPNVTKSYANTFQIAKTALVRIKRRRYKYIPLTAK